MITPLALSAIGTTFIILGFTMRESGKQGDSKAFVIGGMMMLILVALSLVLGWSLD